MFRCTFLAALLVSTAFAQKKDKPMAFGPFIAAAGWIAMIWGQDILDHYSRAGGFG